MIDIHSLQYNIPMDSTSTGYGKQQSGIDDDGQACPGPTHIISSNWLVSAAGSGSWSWSGLLVLGHRPSGPGLATDGTRE